MFSFFFFFFRFSLSSFLWWLDEGDGIVDVPHDEEEGFETGDEGLSTWVVEAQGLSEENRRKRGSSISRSLTGEAIKSTIIGEGLN